MHVLGTPSTVTLCLACVILGICCQLVELHGLQTGRWLPSGTNHRWGLWIFAGIDISHVPLGQRTRMVSRMGPAYEVLHVALLRPHCP